MTEEMFHVCHVSLPKRTVTYTTLCQQQPNVEECHPTQNMRSNTCPCQKAAFWIKPFAKAHLQRKSSDKNPPRMVILISIILQQTRWSADSHFIFAPIPHSFGKKVLLTQKHASFSFWDSLSIGMTVRCFLIWIQIGLAPVPFRPQCFCWRPQTLLPERDFLSLHSSTVQVFCLHKHEHVCMSKKCQTTLTARNSKFAALSRFDDSYKMKQNVPAFTGWQGEDVTQSRYFLPHDESSHQWRATYWLLSGCCPAEQRWSNLHEDPRVPPFSLESHSPNSHLWSARPVCAAKQFSARVNKTYTDHNDFIFFCLEWFWMSLQYSPQELFPQPRVSCTSHKYHCGNNKQ